MIEVLVKSRPTVTVAGCVFVTDIVIGRDIPRDEGMLMAELPLPGLYIRLFEPVAVK